MPEWLFLPSEAQSDCLLSTVWESIALNQLMIFFPLMLQKPGPRSKTHDHNRYLVKRLQLWKDGKIEELLLEAEEIQRRMLKSKKRKKEGLVRGFTRLMFDGKVRQALKLIDADNEVTGVHEMSNHVLNTLQEKHPEAVEPDASVWMAGDVPQVQNVIFEAIDGEAVQSAARNVHGSGGPTNIDAGLWKHVLCSKRFGRECNDLANEVALATRRLCVEDIPNEAINLLADCRLIPLMKEGNGVRPIGIGECLRRIMGKCVAKVVKNDVQLASGTLQTCTGLEAGIEASIHAMSRIFDDEQTDAVLLVDAENAFNRINRKTALHNTQYLCPPLFRFLNNTYKEPVKLHLGDGSFIMSEEGVTQGDPLAMHMYALSTRKIIDTLDQETENVTQVWFADDSAGGGKLGDVLAWWTILNDVGPKYGYHPKASKTWLVVKNPDMMVRARQLFGDEVKITCEGHRHIGSALGNDDFKKEFVLCKVEKWLVDLHQLVSIAKEEPQVALSAFNTGLSKRWKFIQRVLPDIGHLLQPLEDSIREKLIPALCGRHVSNLERQMLSLPYRLGGLGIENPVASADHEFQASCKITQPLVDLIIQQEKDLTILSSERVAELKKECHEARYRRLREEADAVAEGLDEKSKRLLLCAQEKGASSWLSALPLKCFGYVVNKREFRDAICLRYGWRVSDMPAHCGCGQANSIDHLLVCKKGGYVILRHNALRDTEAKILKEVCNDVQTEPALIPTNADVVEGNTQPNARTDISARGVWTRYEKTFFDVRVCHPTAESHVRKSLATLYAENEREKKREYGDRIRHVERASFTPLVFLTTGGMAPECARFNKRLAELIAMKTGERYSDVIRHIRTRLRFALLKSTVAAIRGFRGPMQFGRDEEDLKDISFNLIPQVVL